MSTSKNKSFIRLGIIAGIILLSLLVGYLTQELQLVIDILSAIGLVLIGITILVTIHELGHFLTAKAFGMRVETFSIGFPPKIFSFTKGETEYQFGATPLGGYVKITGIIDESLDTEHLNQEPKPYEFRAKPVWQRLIVMVGGVVMNVILGIFIFSMMKFTYGEMLLPMSEVKYGISVSEPRMALPKKAQDSIQVQSLGYFLGFRTGDKLLTFKGDKYPYFRDYVNQKNLLEDNAYFEVLRDGKVTRIEIPGNVQNYFSSDTIEADLFTIATPSIISVTDSFKNEDVGKISPAFAAGLRTGDKIIRLDSTEIELFSDISLFLKGKKNQEIMVSVDRNGQVLSFPVRTTDEGYLGVRSASATDIYQFEERKYGFFESFVPGTKEAFGFLSVNVKGISNLGRSDVDAGKSVMGPFQIARVYLQAFREGGVQAFLRLTGMLSMILAFVNILPIPALDGGHVVFLLIEAITRKEPSVKLRIISQQIGMVFILGLMLVIIFNDVFKLVG